MMIKLAAAIFLLFSCISSTEAQVRPVRKGVTPVEKPVAKSNPANVRIEQFQGKWQEIKRIPVSQKEEIPFSDSLLIKFSQTKVEIKDVTSMRMTMKGLAEIIAPNILNAAGDEFIVLGIDSLHLILNDGEFIRTLQKRDQYAYESYGKTSIAIDSMNTAIIYDPNNINGKWSVYRRQAIAGEVSDEAFVIKSLEIFPSDRQGSANGKVAFYQGGTTSAASCNIVFSETSLLVITETHTWDFSIYKADGKTLVFGEKDRLLYYAKHF